MNNSDSDAVVKELVEVLTVKALEYLLETEFLPEALGPVRFYVTNDDSRLSVPRFLAAASIDANGVLYVAVRRGLNLAELDEIVRVIAHEAIHLAQMAKKDLDPRSGYSLWRGTPYANLHGDHPRYFDDQPWEREARDLESALLTRLLTLVEHYK